MVLGIKQLVLKKSSRAYNTLTLKGDIHTSQNKYYLTVQPRKKMLMVFFVS